MMDDDGGVLGNWDELDHERFLKLRQMYSVRPIIVSSLLDADKYFCLTQNEDEFVARCARELPEHSLNSVREHVEW
jgi:hypothetical protein